MKTWFAAVRREVEIWCYLLPVYLFYRLLWKPFLRRYYER